jgi:hypothetical protein
MNPFACRGEAENIYADLSISDVRHEIDKRVTDKPAPETPNTVVAHRACIIAELMRRVGDSDAPDYYEKAIQLNPDEPGYELWYGYYLRNVRGPHVEQAERHYYAALEKLEARKQRGDIKEVDTIVHDWVQRGLVALYQQDGQPLLPWKAHEFRPSGLMAPGLSLSTIFSISRDTRDFFRQSEARGFAAEAAFASSVQRLNRPLTSRERWDIARAPLRYELFNRARIRHNYLGALDLFHRSFKFEEGQIADFRAPQVFTDVDMTELGVGFSRHFDLYPLFDVKLDARYSRVNRTGVVELQPEYEEQFPMYYVSPTISRFIGPDKLSVNLTYVLMDIPRLEAGAEYERERGQVIRSVTVDYAMYRPFLLPQLERLSLRLKRRYLRGWHIFGGYAQDDTIYGFRTVTKRDLFLGTRITGLGHYDVTLQGTAVTSNTRWVPDINNPAVEIDDPHQQIKQFRSTAVLLRRLVDEDVTPGMPESFAGVAPALLNLVIPISHDKTLEGTPNYENVRAGAELWFKAISAPLGGTTFLLTAGYDYQYFYRLEKHMHMGHLDLRMGW